MRLLVTGGAGYVGSTTAWLLADAGHEVHLLDDLSTGHRELAGAGPLHACSLLDEEAVAAVFAGAAFDGVLHFAASVSVAESVAQPLSYYRNNLGATLVLLGAMRRHGVSRLVFSSTAAVYGEPRSVPIHESHPLDPVSPYGWSKRMVEQALADCGRAWGLRWTALRYFNAAGAEAGGRCGEWHEPESHLVPLALRAAAGRGEPLAVFGDDWPTPDGTAVRDYVHVSDLADAHTLALERLAAGGASGPINLGAGRGCSVREVLAAVARVTGREVPHRVAPPADELQQPRDRPGDQAQAGVRVVRRSAGRTTESSQHVHGDSRITARRVHGQVQAVTQGGHVIGAQPPAGQPLSPAGGGQRRVGALLHPRRKLLGGQGREDQPQVPQVALGIDGDHRHAGAGQLLEQHHTQPRLAAAGHAHNDAMCAQVIRRQPIGLVSFDAATQE